MEIMGYTAMTAAEFQSANQLPSSPAWMACHFSCYGTGLTNLPQYLPPGTMVIINDRTPVQGHDPEVIAEQLSQLYISEKPAMFLLDLQRPDNPETTAIVHSLVSSLPCPVGVSSLYAQDLDCPVFLPPPAIDCPLQTHLQPWAGRDIWLEMAEDFQTATITEKGCRFSPSVSFPMADDFVFDSEVCCFYRTEIADQALIVHLQRDRAALKKMLSLADDLGISLAIGLYQQLGADFFNKDTLRV